MTTKIQRLQQRIRKKQNELKNSPSIKFEGTRTQLQHEALDWVLEEIARL